MKQLPRSIMLATVAIALGGLAPHTLAQPNAVSSPTVAHSSGTVFGRVQNVVTGNYLNKARVAVKGTEIVAYTDEFGSYRLVDVPAGATTLEVFYTDLDVQQV